MNGQNAGVQRYAVAFASFAPLDTDTFIADRDGGNAKPFLRHPDLDYDASFSADGRWVVFTSTRNGSADMGIEDIQKIRSALRERGSTQIVSVDLATSDRTVLTEGRGEKWSPHWIAGRRLAYVSRDPDGGVELVGGPGGARGEMRNPSWSPDRGHMVFHREVGSGWPPVRRLWSRDASFELLRTAVFPSSSPTGDRLVVNDERAGILHNSILLMSGDGSARSILFGEPDRSALAPAWSPQGDKIAAGIGRFFQDVQGASTADIAVMDLDGKNLRVLTDGSANYGLPSWSPDGRRLVCRLASKDANGLVIIDLVSRALTTLCRRYVCRRRCQVPGRRVHAFHRESGQRRLSVRDLRVRRIAGRTGGSHARSHSLVPCRQ